MTELCIGADTSDRLIDAVGTQHQQVSGEFSIACLVPSITELLFDLNLGKRVVARTGYCIHPRDLVGVVPKVGGTKQINLEKLKKLAPSHVILNLEENTRECALALRDFIPNLVVTHPKRFIDNVDLYRLLGGIFNRSETAQQFESDLTEQLRQHQLSKAQPLRVMYLIWKNPWMSVAPTTYIADTLLQVGFVQIELPTDRPYPTVDFLSIDWTQVDAVFLSSEPYSFTQSDLQDCSAQIEKLALRKVPVLFVDGELISWYGSRALKAPRYLAQLRRDLDANGSGNV